MSIRDRYAQLTIRRHQEHLNSPEMPYERGLPRPRQVPATRDGDPVSVGIIGAGASGLYASLIIDSLDDPRIVYEIFDANPMKDRKGGGRLHTYNFPGGGINDYFDIGAMRFPDIPFMKPVFDLIRDNPKSPIHGMLDIIDYNISEPNNRDLSFYNGIIRSDADIGITTLDPFATGIDPPDTVSNMVSKAIGELKAPFTDPSVSFQDAWDALMQWDRYSTRTYISFIKPKYSDAIINYMETFNTATNLFDQALTETVMDDLDFDFAPNVKWHCIQGGAGQIADAMASKLQNPIEYGKRVIAIAPVTPSGGTHPTSVNVTVAGEEKLRNYSHVISTMPFSCLRLVDTTACKFDWAFQTAMRALHYDSSVKVAIRFTRRWWEDSTLAKGAHHGGVSTTDRPTRTVVYPSYGIGGKTGATMIASYTWAQDAMRMGALANTPSEHLIIEGIIKDLADMHELDYTTLNKMVEGYKIHDWYADEYAAGAFALFGPGQFHNLYPAVTQPIGGLLHFAGEATSVHHAWVVGSFNSAYRTVYEILFHQGFHDLITKMEATWPKPDEFDPSLLKQQVAIGQDMKFKPVHH